nr:MAG TPA: hypothetical protein [Caudoviricetes sp.]
MIRYMIIRKLLLKQPRREIQLLPLWLVGL